MDPGVGLGDSYGLLPTQGILSFSDSMKVVPTLKSLYHIHQLFLSSRSLPFHLGHSLWTTEKITAIYLEKFSSGFFKITGRQNSNSF